MLSKALFILCIWNPRQLEISGWMPRVLSWYILYQLCTIIWQGNNVWSPLLNISSPSGQKWFESKYWKIVKLIHMAFVASGQLLAYHFDSNEAVLTSCNFLCSSNIDFISVIHFRSMSVTVDFICLKKSFPFCLHLINSNIFSVLPCHFLYTLSLTVVILSHSLLD